MKLPTQVHGNKKIRDAAIIRMYADTNHNYSLEEVGSRFKISGSRVQQIVYRNRHLLEIDVQYEKLQQVKWHKRQLTKKGDSKKDSLDVQKSLTDVLRQDRTQINIDNRKVEQNFNFGEMSDEQLINLARKRNIAIPDSITARVGESIPQQQD